MCFQLTNTALQNILQKYHNHEFEINHVKPNPAAKWKQTWFALVASGYTKKCNNLCYNIAEVFTKLDIEPSSLKTHFRAYLSDQTIQ